MTSFLACVLRARSKTFVAAPIKSATSVAMMSITTIISISVNAAGSRLLDKFIFSVALVNAGQWLASAFAVLVRRPTARQEATPNIFASEAARLRGIMSKIVKGVAETRSSKLGQKGGATTLIRLRLRARARA